MTNDQATAIVARRYPDAALRELTEAERAAFLRLFGIHPVRAEVKGLDPAERSALRSIPPDPRYSAWTNPLLKPGARIFEVRATVLRSWRNGRRRRVGDRPGEWSVIGRGVTPRAAWADAVEELRQSHRLVFGKELRA